jgi:hypothetical protein
VLWLTASIGDLVVLEIALELLDNGHDDLPDMVRRAPQGRSRKESKGNAIRIA